MNQRRQMHISRVSTTAWYVVPADDSCSRSIHTRHRTRALPQRRQSGQRFGTMRTMSVLQWPLLDLVLVRLMARCAAQSACASCALTPARRQCQVSSTNGACGDSMYTFLHQV